MPAQLDPDKRQQIVDAINAGGTRNAIARELGCSPSTVTRVAQEDDLDTSAWDRDSVKRAQGAKDADIAAMKAELALLLMGDAFDLRERAWERQEEWFGSMEGPSRVVRPTNAAEFRNFFTAVGIIVDKIGVLTRDDSQGLAAVDSWLRSLGVGATTP